jgi:hypothetical protein
MGYNNTNGAVVKQGKIAFGALNWSTTKIYAKNMLGGYCVIWGAFTAITCGVNYIALPVLLFGLYLHNSTKELL